MSEPTDIGQEAVRRFLAWCVGQGIELVQLSPHEYVHPSLALKRWVAGHDRHADWRSTPPQQPLENGAPMNPLIHLTDEGNTPACGIPGLVQSVPECMSHLVSCPDCSEALTVRAAVPVRLPGYLRTRVHLLASLNCRPPRRLA